MPSGAFLMDAEGNKSRDDDGLQRLTLKNVKQNNDLYKNGNDMAYGETFLFCIPKATAEQMDEDQDELTTKILTSMNVDRYNVYAASTISSGVQPVIMLEPAVQKLSASVQFNTEIFIDYTSLKVLKTNENGAPLAGCTFQISYQQDGTPKTQEQITDGNGEAVFDRLLLNVDVTIKETAASESYATDGADIQAFNWDNTLGVMLTFKNAPLLGIQIYKYDKDSKEPLTGATFEIRRDGQVLQTVKTDENGETMIENL